MALSGADIAGKIVTAAGNAASASAPPTTTFTGPVYLPRKARPQNSGLADLAAKAAAGYAIYSTISALVKKTSIPAPKVKFENTDPYDYRVKLRVPAEYLASQYTAGPGGELKTAGGIIFPYTPQISFDNVATYTPQQMIHSNYAFNVYKGSNVSNITLTAKFTVQNDSDAGVYLSTLHLLRALTKMKFGNDSDAGSPPPVCRLDAYGNFMLKAVPVAVSAFRIELPDNVDYYTPSTLNAVTSTDPKSPAPAAKPAHPIWGVNMIPTVSTFAITLVPSYSRYEQTQFSVTDHLAGALKGKGFI